MSCIARGITQRLKRTEHHVYLLLSRRSMEHSLSSGLETVKGRSYKLNVASNFIKTLSVLNRSSGRTSRSGKKNCDIKLVPEIDRAEVHSILQRYGISKEEVSNTSKVFKLPSGVVEHRLQFCSEGGLRNNIECVTKFENITKTSVSMLKSNGVLSQDVIVPQEILSKVNYDGLPPPLMDEDLPYQEIHFQTVCHYMKECYGFAYPKWKRYIHASLKFTIENMLSLKKTRLHKQWIRDHPTILCFAQPSNLKRIMDLDNFVLPLSIYKLIRWDARISFVNADDLKSIFFLLMKHKICKHDLLEGDPGIFMMDPDFVHSQFTKLEASSPPEHSNRLLLLYKLKFLNDKMKKIVAKVPGKTVRLENDADENDEASSNGPSWRDEMKLWFESDSCSILEYKSCSHSFSVHQGIKTLKKVDRLPMYLSDVLGINPNTAKTELSRLPLWYNVNTEDVQENIDFLFEYGYEDEDILGNLQLLLYPSNIVREVLLQRVISDPVYGSEEYKRKHLHLCLYHILIQHSYSLSIAPNGSRNKLT